MIAAILFLLFLSAAFSATETAYTSLSIIDQKKLESKRSKSAKIALSFTHKSDVMLTTVLIGNNLVNLSLSALVTSMTISRWGNAYIGAATGILTLVLLVFGEISPKQIAMHNSVGIALTTAIPLKILTIVLFPVIWCFRQLSRFINFLFRGSDSKRLTPTSLMHIADAAEDQGVVDQYESDLMQRAIYFSETQIRTVMTHRTEVFCMDDCLTIRQAFPLMVESGFSRVPLYHGNRENITGVLVLKDLLSAQVAHGDAVKISTLAKKPQFVPESMHIDDLFTRFKRQNLNMAIVLDEYGGFSGVVTMEDIVEQLFGEIYDEHEKKEGDLVVPSTHNPGSWIVQADTPMQQFIETLDINEEEPEFRSGTIASYLLDIIGDIPRIGQIVTTPAGTFRILAMTKNRVDTVLFTPAVPPEDE